MILAGRIIDQQPQRTVVVGDEDVEVAVVVDVADGHAAADVGDLEHRAGAARDVFELHGLP